MGNGSIDRRTVPDQDIAGLSWAVTVDPDDFFAGTSSPDGDCYTASQVAAYARGDWYYVTVGVTPVIGGVELDGLTEYLGGVEYGTCLLTTEDDAVTGTLEIGMDCLISGSGEEYEAYPVPDMISECKAGLARMAPTFAEVFGQVRGGVTPEPAAA